MINNNKGFSIFIHNDVVLCLVPEHFKKDAIFSLMESVQQLFSIITHFKLKC